jgi:hypothetical protein
MKTQFWKKLGSLILDKNDDPDEKRILGWIFAGILVYYLIAQIHARLPIDLAFVASLGTLMLGLFGISVAGDKQPNNTPAVSGLAPEDSTIPGAPQ